MIMVLLCKNLPVLVWTLAQSGTLPLALWASFLFFSDKRVSKGVGTAPYAGGARQEH